MALSIRDPETDRLARELAALTSENLTETIRKALAERLAREERSRAADDARRRRDLRAMIDRVAALPSLDERFEDEILGYDERGIPG